MSLVIDYSNGVFEAVPSGETVGTITGNATLDLTSGNLFNHTPTANTTFVFSNPPTTGSAYDMTLKVVGANVATGYDLANASYDSVSFDVSSQDGSPFDIQFKTDGTKFYIAGSTNDAIFQYSLSTAWDISTASYENKSLSISSQETSVYSLRFKDDGTSVYVLGQGNDTIYQYDLTTAWDISTGSYASKSFSVASQDAAARGLHFKPDGTKVYIAGNTNDTVYQYSLSTAWDISTASYDSVSFSFSSQTTNPTALFFKPDGTEMFIVGGFSFASVYKYTLSTAWDISTASYSSVSFSVSSQDASPFGIDFKYDDGLKMYIAGATSDIIYQYSTSSSSTALATLTYPSSVKWAGGTAPPAPAVGKKDVYNFFTLDGGTTYYGFQGGDDFTALPTLDGASVEATTYSINQSYINGLFVAPDEDKFAITQPLPDDVINYTMSTAGDLSTVSAGSTVVDVTSTDPHMIYMGPVGQGTQTWISRNNSNQLKVFTNSTAWVMNTATGTSYSLGANDAEAFWFSNDGYYLFRVSTFDLYRFPLSTAWDISTAGSSTNIDMTSKVGSITAIQDMWMDSSGRRAFLAQSGSSGIIEEYNLTTAYDFSSAVYTGNSLSPTGGVGGFSVVGQNLYVANGTVQGDGKVRKYILGYN